MSNYNFQNPKIYVSTPPQPKAKKYYQRPNFWKIVFLLTMVIVLSWFLFFSSFFKIASFQIEGAADPSIQSEIDKNFIGKNIFFLNTDGIKKIIRRLQPTAVNIDLRRGIPNLIRIKIENEQPTAVWQTGDKSYLLSKDGFILGTAPDILPSSLVKIIDKQNLPVLENQEVATGRFLDFVTKVRDKMKNDLSLETEEVWIEDSTFQVTFKTTNFSVIFDTTRDLDNQVGGLKTVLDKHKAEITKYVDLRVNGRAYWQ